MALIDVIKRTVKIVIDGMDFTEEIVAEVIAIDPLQVKVSERLILTEDFLLVSESVTEISIDLSHNHGYLNGVTQSNTDDSLTESVIIRRGLEVGDEVIVTKIQGGQGYIIKDRVVRT